MACTLVTLWRAKFSGTETTKRRKMYDCFDCSKGIIVFTNVLFVLLGGVLISIGGMLTFVNFATEMYTIGYMLDIPDLHAFSTGGIAFGIIACGIMILLIAILGCCGAQCQSKMFLCPYAALVCVCFILGYEAIVVGACVDCGAVGVGWHYVSFACCTSKCIRW